MARKVGMSNKDFLMKLQEWGVELKSHLNVIEEKDMKIIQEKLKQVGDKKGEMKDLNSKEIKKSEKKKDEPRIIRREIVQVNDEVVTEDKKGNSDFEYDLKPKKNANPEQFRRSDAQIEKKNAPIPSIMDLFKPKTEPIIIARTSIIAGTSHNFLTTFEVLSGVILKLLSDFIYITLPFLKANFCWFC
jgi:hypothetical protein